MSVSSSFMGTVGFSHVLVISIGFLKTASLTGAVDGLDVSVTETAGTIDTSIKYLMQLMGSMFEVPQLMSWKPRVLQRLDSIKSLVQWMGSMFQVPQSMS